MFVFVLLFLGITSGSECDIVVEDDCNKRIQLDKVFTRKNYIIHP